SAAASALDSLRRHLYALGPPPDQGPWTAPAAIIAGTAGDRPEGVATGPAGQGDGAGFEIRDRAGSPGAPLSAEGRTFHDRFVAALDDDLDLPRALALVREILRSRLSPDERRWLILDADLVLGLDLHRTWAETPSKPGLPA